MFLTNAKSSGSLVSNTVYGGADLAGLENRGLIRKRIKIKPATAGPKYINATVDSEITLGDFAAKHGADAKRLNELNGLDLTAETVLAKGSELIVPVQP